MTEYTFLKCTECGGITPYKGLKYSNNTLVFNHEEGCSQSTLAYPRLYLQCQATNPSHNSED